MYLTLQFGLSLTSVSNNSISENVVYIFGNTNVGSTLKIANPTLVYTLTDDGDTLFDGSRFILGFGALPNSYQWTINGVAVPGATAVTFTVPTGTPIGSTIQCNNSNILTVI